MATLKVYPTSGSVTSGTIDSDHPVSNAYKYHMSTPSYDEPYALAWAEYPYSASLNYTFDLSSIPYNAIINSISCTVTFDIYASASTTRSGSLSIYGSNGTLASISLSPITKLGNKTLSCGSVDRAYLDSFGLNLSSRDMNSDAYARIMGATLIVDYTILQNSGVNATEGTLGSQAIGNVVSLNVNGAPTNFIVVHQGNPNSSLYDSSCDGTWLLMQDIYTTSAFYTGTVSNNYGNSLIHTYLNDTFIPLLDEDIRNAVKEVKIPYQAGGNSSLKTGSSGLTTKAFILSLKELGLTHGSANESLTALSYFSNVYNVYRIAYRNGSISAYWTRTPYWGLNTNLFYIDTKGGYGTLNLSSSGVRPALILPSDISVNSSGNVFIKSFNGYVNIDGVNKKLSGAYVNVGGVWKEISNMYMNVSGGTPATLPSGYTKVEYLESSGTQYIDTGFKPNQDTSIIVDAMPLSVGNTTTDSGMIFGSCNPVLESGFEVYAYDGEINGIYNGSYAIGSSVSVGQRLHIEFLKNVCTATSDGETILSNTFTYASFTSTVNLTLFMLPRTTRYYGKTRLYSCKVYDNRTLIRDFIPCVNSSGTAGLYDIVNDVFYTNAGSGTFTVGQTVGADGGIWKPMMT